MCALVTGVQTCALPICRRLRRDVLRGLVDEKLQLQEANRNNVKVGDDEIRRALGMIGRQNKIGRASCRERVCQYVSISVVDVSLKKKKKHEDNRNNTNTTKITKSRTK